MWWQPGDLEVERGNQAVSGNLGLRDNFLLVLSHTSCLSAMPTLFYSHKNAICHETASFMRTMESKRESRVFPLHIKQSRRCQNMRTLRGHICSDGECAPYALGVYTHPECVSVEEVWVTTSLAREEDRTCCELWLQLGPIMLLWLCGCCRGSVWGWCSCGCGCACWVIQDRPLWERIWGERGETLAFLQGSCSLRG